MKTEDNNVPVPKQAGALSIIDKQLQLKNRILDTHRNATAVDEFHVPRDGSLYEAVERLRPSGTIWVESGTYQIDKVLHITKPLSIVGVGEERALLTSKLEEHYLNVRHDGCFEFKKMTMKSEDPLHGRILSVDCGKLLVEQNVFIGMFEGKTELVNNEKRNWESCALLIDGKTSGSIRDNLLSHNINGLVLKGATEIGIINNNCENDMHTGVRYEGTATGVAEGNICMNNNLNGIWVKENASPSILRNTCESNGNGIQYSGGAIGTTEENICRKNIDCGICVSDNSAPILQKNICEDNDIGTLYSDSATGIAVGNVYGKNKRVGIYVRENASPSILKNTCIGSDYGILYSKCATGTAESNICRENKQSGILVTDNASPSLLGNICEANEKYGIKYFGDAAGVAEGNVCRENKRVGIFVTANASPEIENNVCKQNKDFGIMVIENASPKLLNNIEE